MFKTYSFTKQNILLNSPMRIGVYYIGHINNGYFIPDYIGSSDNIQRRLTEHLAENKWSDVTHFAFTTCRSIQEAQELEQREIQKYKPKYNKIGVRLR